MNEISKLLDGSMAGQFCKACVRTNSSSSYLTGLCIILPGLTGEWKYRGERKKSWHYCKNSLELVRQSMHIFTNIFSGEGGRTVHNLDLQRGMFNLHSTLATYMELYSPPLSKHR